ncbi:OmpH family outer membrane protein [Abyssalbus ytuae]|uniref:OmpH family outer membrane protein n=1 Tax=Abyssalbus ytuae TaxID=2926907 RepID=A0A9E6ZRV1_9FLAO|nr:OmpH family outer membrane protein [Abyssalbus ytuae]UOB19325.1 OmpH family outer membrane protein [Abyssalbus ytuae]
MKKLILGILIISSFASCEQSKIAFVDNAKLLNDYQEKKDIEAKFKTKAEKFQKRADSLSRAFQTEALEFESKSKTLSQKKAQEQYNVLMQKRQLMGQQLQSEEIQIQQQGQKEIDSLVKKVRNFVKEYGKKNQYTFILGNTESGSVLYGEETKDVTEAVLKELNDTYNKK